MNFIFTSDQHMAHRRTPTRKVINSFVDLILTEELENIDVLFLGGDLYDRLIDASSQDNFDIIAFCGHLLDICCHFDVAIRAIKGTPAHDWDQCNILTELNNLRNLRVDLKYFDVLDIEYMEKFDKYVLYIPDEWSKDHDDVERQINEKLIQHGIKQVDYAILHGLFHYQMLGIPFTGFAYKEEYFLSLVKEYILIGHFHIYSHFDRIWATGSLERLAHGEESDKGFGRCINGKMEFVINHDAMIYKTLKLNKNDTLNTLDKKVGSYPKGSFIRLQMNKDHPLNSMFKDLSIRYIDYHLDRKIKDEEIVKNNDILSDDHFNFRSFEFIGSDMVSVVKEIVDKKYNLNETEKSKLDMYLKEFKGSESKEEME